MAYREQNNSYWEVETDNMILFWGGVLSNWYKSDFVVFGNKYTSAEQFMMHAKASTFCDYRAAEAIMSTNNPRKQKALGRTVKNFNEEFWSVRAQSIFFPGILAKFQQNDSLKEILLSTEDKIIAEASPYDKIWGIGLAPSDLRAQNKDNWKGTNLLGETLMEVRKSLSIL